MRLANGEGEPIGFVTSGLYSPSLKRTIALASVKVTSIGATGGVGTDFLVTVGDADISAVGVTKPFIAALPGVTERQGPSSASDGVAVG